MRINLSVFVLFIVLLLTTSIQVVFPQKILAEEISDYNVKINILRTGQIDVTETIKYDFGTLRKHGIIREIPIFKTNLDNKKYVLKFENFNVTDQNGEKIRFDKSNAGDNINLKIGDPNSTITGVNTYKISYTVSGALTYFENFDELYWNAIGTGWKVPINGATIDVTIPELIDEKDLITKCYTGELNSVNTECDIKVNYVKPLDTTTGVLTEVSFITLRKLNNNEGVTIALAFTQNIVDRIEPELYRTSPFVLFFYFLLILAGIALYIVYPIKILIDYIKNKKNIDTKARILTADYDIPKINNMLLSPAQVGMLVDKTVGKEDFTATIIDLAVRKFFDIKIDEIKDWNPFTAAKKVTFIRNKSHPPYTELKEFESLIFNKMFENNDEITAKKLGEKYATDNTLYKFEKAVSKSMVDLKLTTNDLTKTKNFYQGIGLFGVTTLNPLLAIISSLLGQFLLKLTDNGIEVFAKSKSLNNFLSATEHHINFQAENQYWFEKLLPYATSFKVEKIWMERFKDLHLKNPEWIKTNNTDLSSVNLINTLNTVTSSVSTVHASSTSRSSSGFSSGSSGGSSGGGGGGGGGGSW